MAGAGYKVFNVGDILTAQDVRNYLQEQVVMRFATTTARTTALASVLAEGMVSYIDATDTVEVYNGSAWVAVGGSTVLTTKGDLFTYSTTNARLGVGSDGDTLLADSTSTTGLRWSADWNIGKNKIINGDFRINQRAFTSNTASGSYNFDRWLQTNSGGSFTVTPQTFTAGAAPVAPYEAINFLRGITASQSAAGDLAYFSQRIEDVRTLANQSVTVSFWAKANTGTPKIGVELSQNFGSGGSPSAQVNTPGGAVTLSTSWARYSVTITNPSITGKTIGTTANSSYLELNLWTSSGSTNATRASSIGIQNWTADIWGVQVEAGSVATPFTTAGGTLQGELALCQRYYVRNLVTSGAYRNLVQGNVDSSNQAASRFPYYAPVPMRIYPNVLETNNIAANKNSTDTRYTSGTWTLATATPTVDANQQLIEIVYTHGTAVFTAGSTTTLQTNNATTQYFALGAEL